MKTPIKWSISTAFALLVLDTKTDLRGYMNKTQLIFLAAPENWEYQVMLNVCKNI